MTWYARTGPRRNESGKFQSHAHLGPARATGEEYRGWHLEFVTHKTGSSVRRTRYAVAISDPNKNRAAYLRDFSSLQQATTAAQQWIDHTLGQSLSETFPTHLGSIPRLPGRPFVQEK